MRGALALAVLAAVLLAACSSDGRLPDDNDGTTTTTVRQSAIRSVRYSGCVLNQADARRIESSLFLLMNL